MISRTDSFREEYSVLHPAQIDSSPTIAAAVASAPASAAKDDSRKPAAGDGAVAAAGSWPPAAEAADEDLGTVGATCGLLYFSVADSSIAHGWTKGKGVRRRSVLCFCKHQRQTLESSSPLGKLVSNNGMPRAASPSAASRHRLLLPPLLAGLDFCRLAAPTSSAASRPTSSRPSWHASRCLAPSAAFTGWPRLLPPCGSASFCRLAAPNCRLAAFLPPSGPTSSGLVGRGAPRTTRPRAQGLTRVSPELHTIDNTSTTCLLRGAGTGTSPTVMTTKWSWIERSCGKKTIAIGANPD
ncbi:hypothetical protein HRG_013212 [Hirsutella rhossiliensis]